MKKHKVLQSEDAAVSAMSSDEMLAEAVLAFSSNIAFTSTYFHAPKSIDPNEMWTPYEFQRRIYNVIDFGYDIEKDHFEPILPVSMLILYIPRQWGKTEVVATAADALATRYPNSDIGVIAQDEKRAIKFVTRAKSYIYNSIFNEAITNDIKTSIEYENGSVISAFPNNESIRGESLRWLIIDEAAQIDEDVLVGAAFPTVDSAGIFNIQQTPSIIMLSTPYGQDNIFWDYYQRGLGKRWIGCTNCEWKAHNGDILFDKIIFHPYEMPKDMPYCPECHTNDHWEYIASEIYVIHQDPYLHPFLTREEIDRKLDLHGNTPKIRQEVLGEVLGDSNGVFTEQLLHFCTNFSLHNSPEPNHDLIYNMAVDFGKTKDSTVISIGHLDNETKMVMLDYMHMVEASAEMTYEEIIYIVLSYVNKYNPSYLILDAVGIGEPIVEQLSRLIGLMSTNDIKGVYIKNGQDVHYTIPRNKNIYTKIYSNKTTRLGFVSDVKSKFDLIERLVYSFTNRTVQIPPKTTDEVIKTLWFELIHFGYKLSKDNKIKYGTQRAHDDTVISLALLVWVCLDKPAYVYVPAKIGGEHDYVL